MPAMSCQCGPLAFPQEFMDEQTTKAARRRILGGHSARCTPRALCGELRPRMLVVLRRRHSRNAPAGGKIRNVVDVWSYRLQVCAARLLANRMDRQKGTEVLP